MTEKEKAPNLRQQAAGQNITSLEKYSIKPHGVTTKKITPLLYRGNSTILLRDAEDRGDYSCPACHYVYFRANITAGRIACLRCFRPYPAYTTDGGLFADFENLRPIWHNGGRIDFGRFNFKDIAQPYYEDTQLFWDALIAKDAPKNTPESHEEAHSEPILEKTSVDTSEGKNAPQKPVFEGYNALLHYIEQGFSLIPCYEVLNKDNRLEPRPCKKTKTVADYVYIKTKTELNTVFFGVGAHDVYRGKIDSPRRFFFEPQSRFYICIDADDADGIAGFEQICKDLKIKPTEVYVDSPQGRHYYYKGIVTDKVQQFLNGNKKIEIKTRQLTAAGSEKDTGRYILHGRLENAPPIPTALLALCYKSAKSKIEQKPIATRRTVKTPRRSQLLSGKWHFNAEDIEDYKSKNSLMAYCKQHLVWRGGRLFNCPYCGSGEHKSKTPAFTVYENTNSFYCFSCGASGDIFELKKTLEGGRFADIMTAAEYKQEA